MTWAKFVCVALLAFMGVGCVAQREADDLRTLYRRCQEQVEDLRARLDEANARIKALQEAQRSTDPDLLDKLARAIQERDALAKQLADSEGKLRSGAGFAPIMLEPELDQALRDLAAQHPELLSYDPAMGMVRFKSDLTFPLGSTEISANSVQALNQLAQILARPVAQKYESRIVGHTDNVRIGRPETRAKHPTNWHLSVHRSIAVKDVLQKAGVPGIRIMVAGYGEYRPIVPNGPRGAEPNRRVEIYLVPMNYTGPGGGAEPPSADAAPVAAPAPMPAASPINNDDATLK